MTRKSEPTSEAQKRATLKYDAANTVQFHLKLNKGTDAKLIEFLQSSGNVQGTIKAAMEEYMKNALITSNVCPRIKYRPHRGELKEAMQEAKEFNSIDEMKAFVHQQHKMLFGEEPFGLDDIVISSALGDDDRIGWKNVRHVCVKRYLGEDYIKEYGRPQCIGWCGE